MAALSSVGTVVATYTEPVWSVPPMFVSSQLCRYPVTLPQVDVTKVLQYFKINVPKGTDRRGDRLLCVLKFRIAMALQPRNYGLAGLHRPENSSEDVNFFPNLRNTLEGSVLSASNTLIEECIKIASLPESKTPKSTAHDHATDLLLGMSDEEIEKVGRGLNDLVLLKNEMVTTTIFRLLSFEDRDFNSVEYMPKVGIGFSNFFSISPRRDLWICSPVARSRRHICGFSAVAVPKTNR